VIARRQGCADDASELRRLGVTAAALLLLAVTAGCGSSHGPAAHSCGATDRRFLATASVDVTAFDVWRQDYAAGTMTADAAAREAFDSAKRITHVEASDPSLRTAQDYLDGMFTKYGEAVRLHAQGKDGGERMYLAFTFASGAHDVLAQAQPALQREGCDVGALL
jgi:hypothetical protein